MRIRALTVEGDAKEVMENFEANKENKSQTVLILSEAYGLPAKFHYFKAQFVPKICNKVADNSNQKTKVADNFARDRHNQIWYNEVTDSIKDVVSFDIDCLINSLFTLKKKQLFQNLIS